MKIDSEVESILDELGAGLEQERATREANRRSDAPDFNVFEYLQPKENALSQMLGALLDPGGTHGQGKSFLDLFIREFDLGELAHTEVARVCLESRTFALDAARRIDIVITGRGWVLGIENKPAATDQPRQVADYLQDLRLRGNSLVRLLYLTHDGRRPSPDSIAETECAEAIGSGELHTISYGQVVSWLQKCQLSSESRKMSWYLDSLTNYLRRSVLGKLPQREETMIYKTLLDSRDPARLSTVLHLLQAKDAIRTELKRRVMAVIRTGLPKGWEILHALDEDGLLELRAPKSTGWTFGIQSEDSGGVWRWWYGISFDPKASAKQRGVVERAGIAMARRFEQSGPPNEYWAFWRWFEGIDEHEPREYDNWEAHVQPWLDMADGTMARHFLALAIRLGEAMEMAVAKIR
jgi:hypothetical protein